MRYTTDFKGLFALDLRLFDGAGAGSGTGAGGGEGAGAGEGVTGQEAALPASPRRKQRNPLANVQYGRQPEAQPQAQPQQSAQQETAPAQQADPDAEWKDIRNNRYKAQFDADVQSIVRDRLKGRQDAEAQMQQLSPVLETLAKKYGKQTDDLAGIVAAYTNDDSLYAEEADKTGLPVEIVKEMSQLRKRDKEHQEAEAKRGEEMLLQQHFQKLATQAVELKKTFPNFDLRTELQNPRFAQMTSPNGGVSVEDAYFAIHHKEIQQGSMQFAVQKTQQQMAQSIQAGRNRPAENGMTHRPAAEVRDDPSKWSRADRDEVRRRVRMGQKIVL
jgi:hypothetical protein